MENQLRVVNGQKKAIENYKKSQEAKNVLTEEQKKQALNDAGQIAKILKTKGGKIIVKYLKETIENYKMTPDNFISDTENGFVFETDRATYVAGCSTGLRMVLELFESAERIIDKSAKDEISKGKQS